MGSGGRTFQDLSQGAVKDLIAKCVDIRKEIANLEVTEGRDIDVDKVPRLA